MQTYTIIKDNPEMHFNPSKKKIVFFKQKLEKEKTPRETPKEPEQFLTPEFKSIERPLFSTSTKTPIAVHIDPQSKLHQQNKYLKDQISKLERLNIKLIQTLERKDSELTRINNNYKDLLLKYNAELTKINTTLHNQLGASRACSVRHHKTIDDDRQSHYSKSSRISRQSIKKHLLKLKQDFDKLDFGEVYKMAHSKKRTATSLSASRQQTLN